MNRHRATVIVGEQGAGKTRAAHELAARFGRVVVTTWAAIDEPGGLAQVMRSQPAALIVEEMPQLDRAWARVKAMVSSERWVLQNPGGCDVAGACLPVPMIICAIAAPKGVHRSRQFSVIAADAATPQGCDL